MVPSQTIHGWQKRAKWRRGFLALAIASSAVWVTRHMAELLP